MLNEKSRKTLISSSILTADFGRIGEVVGKLEKSGADYIHCDVMDGHFVPNLTFGSKFVGDLKQYTNLPLDVHLMITRPDLYAEKFIEAGASILTFHCEASCDVGALLDKIKKSKVKAGLAISPDTPVKNIEKYIAVSDIILLMSVYPGFGGQKFIERSYERASEIKSLTDKYNPKAIIEIDGGVNFANADAIKACGVEMLVAGNAVFTAPDMAQAIARLRG